MMRWIGALFVLLGCGSFGFSMVATHKKEEKNLRQIICAIGYMECEMQYRLTPLPQLLGQAAQQNSGIVQEVLGGMLLELETQISTDVSCCMDVVLCKRKDVPPLTREALFLLGQSLGRFDLQGQMKELESVRSLCERHLKTLENNRDVRLRSYQTLGLCAGAVLAILLL